MTKVNKAAKITAKQKAALHAAVDEIIASMPEAATALSTIFGSITGGTTAVVVTGRKTKKSSSKTPAESPKSSKKKTTSKSKTRRRKAKVEDDDLDDEDDLEDLDDLDDLDDVLEDEAESEDDELENDEDEDDEDEFEAPSFAKALTAANLEKYMEKVYGKATHPEVEEMGMREMRAGLNNFGYDPKDIESPAKKRADRTELLSDQLSACMFARDAVMEKGVKVVSQAVLKIDEDAIEGKVNKKKLAEYATTWCALS